MSVFNHYPKKGDILNGRYLVKDIIGDGATGIALSCTDLKTGKTVVVKRIFQENLTPALEKKIRTEPKLNIASRYLVKAEEFFQEDGFMHLAMPFVPGESLRRVIDEQGRIDEETAVYITICLTEAASDMHKIMLVDTDLKPENTIITPEGYVKVIDINCFESVGLKAEVSLGTPPYAPPELSQHGILYEATDIFAIGVILLEMLVGAEELDRVSKRWAWCFDHGIKPDISTAEGDYPRAGTIIRKAIEPAPDRRYRNTAELIQELRPYYDSLTGCSSNPEPECRRLILLCEDGLKLKLREGSNILGRRKLDATNPYVSEDHFEIEFNGSSARIRDLDSTNKTRVNGTKIGKSWVSLNDSDFIIAANMKLLVQMV